MRSTEEGLGLILKNFKVKNDPLEGVLTEIESHLAALMKLPRLERLEVANLLFESIEDVEEDPGWERQWLAELSSRISGLMDGSRQAIDATTVFQEARDRFES